MSEYEKDRLRAIGSFFRKLTLDKYYVDNISDVFDELSSEIADTHGHVIRNFSEPSVYQKGDSIYLYDKLTEKHIKISFEYYGNDEILNNFAEELE